MAEDSTTLEVDQLEILVWLYDRIQTQIFSVLAKHAVPRASQFSWLRIWATIDKDGS